MRTPTYLRVDGIRLDGYHSGLTYQFGTTLAMLFLAEGWAVPAEESAPALPASIAALEAEVVRPPNLIRDAYPPDYEGRFAVAADHSGRRRKQTTGDARSKVRRKAQRSSD